ncbi:NUDIX domain-containing protein [Faunimonas pinastri]|uniref:NUDIX domain-containing protein n=1 Tax=Faunimonas pinastri TaxID=1855383 RepID=A0A1H9F951_9HYPH|nr:NUDIX hydrolase [Faunimonas pinastri]SEQ34472.1 NUDIX domain-containing protein [Faunimonas pinastri]
MAFKKRGKKGERGLQVAALPYRWTETGTLEILILTSRSTLRPIIPKGWPMKGKTNAQAAATEANEEAGLIGKIGKEPIGNYEYFKRFKDRFELCRVDVFPFEVTGQEETFREKGQRHMRWLSRHDAALLVDEPQLRGLISSFSPRRH